MTVRVQLRRDAGRIGPQTGPWVRRRQIARFLGVPDPHALAEVVDHRGDTVAFGLVSAVSTIAIRVLTFGAARPPDDWLDRRLSAAFEARRAYRFEEEGTTGYREVNTEGDGLPGLVVDRYGDDLVVQITTAPMAAREDAIVDWLRGHWSGRIHVVRPETAARREGFDAGLRRDDEREVLRFTEHNLAFEVPAPPSQKTGAYHDQRANRRTVAHLARRHGLPMLDVGCHVGGFSLHAARLGVPTVGLDQSKAVLELAAANAAANGLSDVRWVEGDMFALDLDRPELTGPFGTIVFDPPKIAARKKDVDRALRAMQRTLERLTGLLGPGGHLVVCSCSHHIGSDHLDRLVASLPGQGSRVLTRVQALGPGFDHPIAPGHREGAYLTVNVYQRRTW